MAEALAEAVKLAPLEVAQVAPADTVHAKDVQGLRAIGDVYEIPKGATMVFLVLDYSALGAQSVKADKTKRFVRTRVEFSMDGQVFGVTPDGEPSYLVDLAKDEQTSYSMWSECTFNSPELGSLDSPNEKQRCGDVWHPQEIGPGMTHARFAVEMLEPGVKCGFKVVFR